jgi:hypothetical protein
MSNRLKGIFSEIFRTGVTLNRRQQIEKVNLGPNRGSLAYNKDSLPIINASFSKEDPDTRKNSAAKEQDLSPRTKKKNKKRKKKAKNQESQEPTAAFASQNPNRNPSYSTQTIFPQKKKTLGFHEPRQAENPQKILTINRDLLQAGHPRPAPARVPIPTDDSEFSREQERLKLRRDQLKGDYNFNEEELIGLKVHEKLNHEGCSDIDKIFMLMDEVLPYSEWGFYVEKNEDSEQIVLLNEEDTLDQVDLIIKKQKTLGKMLDYSSQNIGDVQSQS